MVPGSPQESDIFQNLSKGEAGEFSLIHPSVKCISNVPFRGGRF